MSSAAYIDGLRSGWLDASIGFRSNLALAGRGDSNEYVREYSEGYAQGQIKYRANEPCPPRQGEPLKIRHDDAAKSPNDEPRECPTWERDRRQSNISKNFHTTQCDCRGTGRLGNPEATRGRAVPRTAILNLLDRLPHVRSSSAQQWREWGNEMRIECERIAHTIEKEESSNEVSNLQVRREPER